MTKLYVDDEGTILDLDTTVDITGAVSVAIEAQKPDGTVVNWSGAVQDTTKVRYVTQSGDIDQSGIWALQALITDLSGFTGRGETVRVQVAEDFT